MGEMAGRENRLAAETSTYLRSASHQEIDWYPWSSEPFERAEREGKPVLLDIGASWCHWCHVMDDGTYGDSEIASFINMNYIAVKVDRDERPDVDSRYQRAVNAMTGQGGWPLTVFLDHTGRPFYGGTYFPPAAAGDMPGFLELLKRLHSYYTTRKDEREEVVRSVTEAVTRTDRYDEEEVGAPEVRAALSKVIEESDEINGGFGYAPKFPHTSAVEFLLSQLSAGRKEALGPLKRTLDRMLAGGIHDQLGGGFHRYSTDEKWIVPHFEKMAYDNAGLLRNYLHGYLALHDDEYLRTARGIVEFVSRTLSGSEGFYASQDADAAPGDDGDYWTWSSAELAQVLEGDERKVAVLYYHVHGMAEMHRSDRHVLYRAMGVGDVSTAAGISQEDAAGLLDSARRKMLAARDGRPRPGVDRNVFASWNGMMASSFFEYGRVTGDAVAAGAAARNVRNYIRHAFEREKGFRHSLSGRSIWGLLEDQVHMLHAAVDLFEAEGGGDIAEIADLSAGLLGGYASPSGGLYDIDLSTYSGEDIGLAAQRSTPVYDSPSLSPNAAAALLLQRVESVFGDENAGKLARSIIRAVAPSMVSSGAFSSSIFIALDQMVKPLPVIVVAGSGESDAFGELKSAAGSAYLPGREIVIIDTGEADAGIYPKTMQSMIAKSREEGRALAFLCRGRSCSAPVENASGLAALVGR